MKKLPLLLLVGAFGLAVSAAEPVKKEASPAPKSDASAEIKLKASAATVAAPLVLKDGFLSQPEQTALEGGKAVFEFTVPTAGTYQISGLVDAPAEDANSFYLNVDAPPADPEMIWDIAVTTGFEERVVCWRGNGTPEESQFSPKLFKLSAGAHKLFIVGREPAKLKGVTIKRVP